VENQGWDCTAVGVNVDLYQRRGVNGGRPTTAARGDASTHSNDRRRDPGAERHCGYHAESFARTVTVVIPAKNEAGNIGAVLSELPGSVTEVILVDGRSTDDTIEVARSVRPDIRVVCERRPGKGSALRTGFQAASGDIVVMLDADGSMTPSEIGRYLALLDDGFDLVKGSRFMAGGYSTDITLLRRSGNRALLALVNGLFRSKFTDLCYGFCAFHREHLDSLLLDASGFEIETQIVLRAVQAGLRIAEVPSVESQRTHGQSNLRTFRDGLRVLRTLFCEVLRPPAEGGGAGHHDDVVVDLRDDPGGGRPGDVVSAIAQR
jgi:Glycosyl transferase family 2